MDACDRMQLLMGCTYSLGPDHGSALPPTAPPRGIGSRAHAPSDATGGRVKDAMSITRALLSPGGTYLISAFQADDREERLEAIGTAFGLRNVLGEAWGIDDTYAQRWGRVLRSAIQGTPAPSARAELTAIVDALEDYAEGRAGATTFWEQAVVHLSGPSITAGTLRHRRWPVVRKWLAEGLARLAPAPAPDSLPHDGLRPSLFSEDDFARLLDQLNGDSNGLAVLVDEAGTGKTQFAMAFARWTRTSFEGRARYDRVLWVRADDPLILEQHYLGLGPVLDPTISYEDPSDVLAVLRRSDRWLLVFDAVKDPALLLRYLPRRATGHVICTTDFDSAEGEQSSTRPRHEQLRDRACEPWQKYFAVPLGDRGEMTLPSPPSRDDLDRLLAFHAIDYDDRDATALLTRVGSSRLALDLAARWLRAHRDDQSCVRVFADRFDGIERMLRVQHSVRSRRRPGFTTAFLLLHDERREGRANLERVHLDSEDDSPLLLLQRLETFAAHPVPVEAVRERVGDPHLDRLEELGLVSTLRLDDQEFVEIHGDVRDAVNAVSLMEHANRERALHVAALTVLDRTAIDPIHPRQGMILGFLPHVVSLAARLCIGETVLPTSSLELTARAAASHWIYADPRGAAEQVNIFKRVVQSDRLQGVVLEDLQAGDERSWSIDLPVHAQRLRERVASAQPTRRLLDMVVLLRRVGFRTGAARLVDYLVPLFDAATQRSVGTDRHARLVADCAQLSFEAALCFRENAELDQARDELERVLREVDDPAEVARCEAMLAVNALDRGQVALALRLLGSSLEARRRILREVTDNMRHHHFSDSANEQSARAERDAWSELARGYFVLARAMYYGALPQTMSISAGISADCWSHSPPSINRATARSNLALSLTLLRLPGGMRLAEMASEEADSTFGPDHHDSALVALNQAMVLALSDDPVDAVPLADSAFRRILRHWPRRHPLVLNSRLLAAKCRAELGRASDALDHLFVLLDDAGLEVVIRDQSPSVEPRTTELPYVRAAAWTAIGNLLLDAVTHVSVEPDVDLALVASGHARAHDLLDTAERCFNTASTLVADREQRTAVAVARGDERPVAYSDVLLQADLGRLEVRLRGGFKDPRLAVDVFHRAVSHSQHDAALAVQVGEDVEFKATRHGECDAERPSLLELRALAKLVRSASANIVGDLDFAPRLFEISPWSIEFWSSLLQPKGGWRSTFQFNARDRMEFALAWLKLVLEDDGSDARAMSGEDADPFETVRRWLDEDLDLLRHVLDDDSGKPVEHHHQVALRYSALAQVPGRDGKNHRRARNLREVERTRVLVSRLTVLHVSSKLDAEVRLGHMPAARP